MTTIEQNDQEKRIAHLQHKLDKEQRWTRYYMKNVKALQKKNSDLHEEKAGLVALVQQLERDNNKLRAELNHADKIIRHWEQQFATI